MQQNSGPFVFMTVEAAPNSCRQRADLQEADTCRRLAFIGTLISRVFEETGAIGEAERNREARIGCSPQSGVVRETQVWQTRGFASVHLPGDRKRRKKGWRQSQTPK